MQQRTRCLENCWKIEGSRGQDDCGTLLGKDDFFNDSAQWSIKAGTLQGLPGKLLQTSCNIETRMSPSAHVIVCCWVVGNRCLLLLFTFLTSHDDFSPVDPELEPGWQVILGNKGSEGVKDDNELRADLLNHGGKIHRKHGTVNSYYWQRLCFQSPQKTLN